MKDNSFDDIRRFKKLEIGTKKLVKDLFAGAWASSYKGQGIEPEDLRIYEPLDPIKFIDWHATARTGKPHIRLFKEERQLTVLLLVDISASTTFGGKREKMAEMASLIAFSALKNGDRAGLLLFSSILEKYFPPKPGSNYILPLIQNLLYFTPTKKGTNIEMALKAVDRLQKKRSVLFLISDFLFSLDTHLLGIMAKKHDLVAIDLNDPLERKLDNLGWVRLQDLEKNQKILINTSKPEFLSDYQERTKAMIDESKRSIEKAGGIFLSLSSTDSVQDKLIEFFARKRMTR